MKPKNKWKVLPPIETNDNMGFDAHIDKALHILNTSETDDVFLRRDIRHDAKNLNDIDVAWARLDQVKNNDEKVLVYGDYDVDGMTSTTIMAEGLQHYGIDTSYVVPDRMLDGYGPSDRLYKAALENGFSVIITTDNGISGAPIIDKYSALGLDVIVTDHHEPNGDMIPTKAIAKVHPMLSPKYEFNGLSGAGVAYKFITYKMPELKEDLEPLAAMGLIADVMPLIDENRRIVYEGLTLLSTTKRPGLKALKQVKNINDANITSDSIGFGLGPMLNSIGRISDPMIGVNLLMSTDSGQAEALSENVNQLNEKRKSMISSLTDEALSQAKSQDAKHQILLVGGSDEVWHQGIVGIVAAKVSEVMKKPTLAMSFKEGSDGENVVHGSARSVPGYDIFQCMKSAEDTFITMGGHSGAAGFGLYQKDINQLQNQLDAYVENHPLPSSTPETKVMDRIEVKDATVEFYDELQKLAPFGEQNPNPIWGLEFDHIANVSQMSGGAHVKFKGFDKDGNRLEVVGFSKGADYDALCEIEKAGTRFFVVGTLGLNVFRGNKTAQLLVVDWGDDFS